VGGIVGGILRGGVLTAVHAPVTPADCPARNVGRSAHRAGHEEVIMGLFGKKKQSPEAADDDVAVYYSTPFGDTKDGKQKLFVLGSRSGMTFFPVFYTKESLTDCFERMNRAAYLIIEGNLKAVAESLRSIELMKNTGIVIEPFSEHPVEIMPGA
jgi:hypothetical protein